MPRMIALIITTALLAVSCTSLSNPNPGNNPAYSQIKPGSDYISKQQSLIFKSYDTNNDNQISTDEYVKKQERIFDMIDKSKTGEVNTEEFLIYWCSEKSIQGGIEDLTLGPVYREMDINHDGTITTQECRAYWIRTLKQYDLNANSKISRYEYDTMMRDRFKNLLDGPDQNGHITNHDYNSLMP